MGDIFKDLASQKECKIEERHLVSNHVHILISIPPKYSVAYGHTLEEKETSKKRVFAHVDIMFQPLEEMIMIRKYIQNQEPEDRRIDQLDLF